MRMRSLSGLAIAIATAALYCTPALVMASSKAENKPGATQAGDPKKASQDVSEQIYGGELMTPEEREAYLKKMHEAKRPEDREKIQADHIKEMRIRAQQRGVTLPKMPPAKVPSN